MKPCNCLLAICISLTLLTVSPGVMGQRIMLVGGMPPATADTLQTDVEIYFGTIPSSENTTPQKMLFFLPHPGIGNRYGQGLSHEYEELTSSSGGDSVQVIGKNGCPGPFVSELSAGAVLIFLNTPWWFYQGGKPSLQECGLEDEGGFFIELEELLREYDDRRTLLIGYHPIKTLGTHSGNFPVNVHFTPPVLGSFYAAYRKWIGGAEDLTNIYYRNWSDEMEQVLGAFPDVVYFSSLEHSFEYLGEDSIHQVIVGDPLRADHIKGNDHSVHVNEPGITLVKVHANGEMEVSYTSTHPVHLKLPDNQQITGEEELGDRNFPQQTAAAATQKLGSPRSNPGLKGNNYRAEWEAVIRHVPVFDLDTLGGLDIVKRGGGQQTRSLRLEAPDGHQYVLRSVEKFPEKAVPVELRNTLAADLIADQISASHPYGALAIPVLARAAGVYHTHPELVYLPDDPLLGRYRKDFADGLYLFEERPDDDWHESDNFGNSQKIISTADVLEKRENDGDHVILQEQTVRSRLFDIWIGDWDRHDDQWRWARFKEGEIKYYAPIPRDRDQAFFWSDGSLLKLISHKWGQPKFQGFNASIRDVNGLAFNARYFDRSFLTEADRSVWIQTAKKLQQCLPDTVIEKGVRQIPDEIFLLHGDEIIRKLKERRDDLVTYATTYYNFLSKSVSITGSDKKDLFEIERQPDGKLLVEVYRIGKTGEKKYRYYSRTFDSGTTDEIRLFAQGDDDKIELIGHAENSPLVRIIGGTGKDIIDDQSKVDGLRRKTVVYDNLETPVFSRGETRERLSDQPDVNTYDRYEFKYDRFLPLITGGYNPDDGIYLGGGVEGILHGFRKEPYAQRHRLRALVAPRSGSYALLYEGEFIEFIHGWDLTVGMDILEPSYAGFFYGYGNKTTFDEEIIDDNRQYYRARFSLYHLAPSLRKTMGNGLHALKLGADFQSVEVGESENYDEERFIYQYAGLTGRGDTSLSPLLDYRRTYLGLRASYTFDHRNDDQLPLFGSYAVVSALQMRQLGGEKKIHQRYAAEATGYITLGGSLRITLAARLGGQMVDGEYEFYQSVQLGGQNTLRGYRKQRFSGEKALYQNLEMRIRLFDFRTSLFPGQFGVLLFHDIGRIWVEQEDVPLVDSSKATWHRGMGGGVWIAPLAKTVISADYACSNDHEKAFFIRMGFFF